MKTRKTKPSQIFPSREKGVSVSTFFQELKINFIALSWEPESLKLEEKEAQGEEGVRVGSTCRALVFKSMKP